MPRKKSKSGKGGGKKKSGNKKGAKQAAEKEEAVKTCRAFLKAYHQNCTLPGRFCSPEVVKQMREGIENQTPVVKFFINGSSSGISVKPEGMISPPPATPSSAPYTKILQPLADSWAESKYHYVCYLYIWSVTLDDDAIVSLALYFESGVGNSMKALELREVGISPWAIRRLSRALSKAKSQLVSVNLDYNRIPQESLVKLCEGLRTCQGIQSLSLNFCEINSYCGGILGAYIATSAVKEVSLIGNMLNCFGCSELIKPLVALWDTSHTLPQPPMTPSLIEEFSVDQTEGATIDKPAVTAPPPLAPPSLAKLYLQDNSIDVHSPCSTGSFDSVLCTRELKRLVMSSALLEELALEGNAIGDGGARELLEGLSLRKEAGLPPVKATVTSSVSPDIFAAILELSKTERGKKKGKKKGKKGKKK